MTSPLTGPGEDPTVVDIQAAALVQIEQTNLELPVRRIARTTDDRLSMDARWGTGAIDDLRRHGYPIAAFVEVDFVHDRADMKSNGDFVSGVIDDLRQRRVLISASGVRGNASQSAPWSSRVRMPIGF